MSFGKEISWEYADNNNFAYLLWSVVKYSLKMKRVLIDCWTRLSQDTEPSDWSAAEKTGNAGP